jgi:phosphoribosylaminoimidazole carboxylase (NCAIR synthetase)
MINLIGNDYKKIDSLKKKYRCYDYFKKEIRDSRKMGHYVILDQPDFINLLFNFPKVKTALICFSTKISRLCQISFFLRDQI